MSDSPRFDAERPHGLAHPDSSTPFGPGPATDHSDAVFLEGGRHRPREMAANTDEAFDRLCTGVVALLRGYVRTVDVTNRSVGLFAMYLLLVMMGILTYAMVTNVVFDSPSKWVMEMAQFTMAAYYLLGGGFTFQDGAHVRMDVFRERWSPRTQHIVDSVTDVILIFYVAVLLDGGISSSLYALEYGQKNYTAWAPPMAPIKIIMTVGILLMLLEAVSRLIKDVAAATGKELR